MTPPISIDGTDITGATIDGTDVTAITVDGDTVFTAVDPDAFDLSKVSADGSFSTSLFAPSEVQMKPDGTRAIVSSINDTFVQQYDLSTPFDFTTASTAGTSSSAFKSGGIFVNGAGTKYFETNYDSDVIDEYNLSTAWDVTSKGSVVNSFSYSSPGIAFGVEFINGGDTMFIVDNGELYEYSLASSFDLSSVITPSTKDISLPSGSTGIDFNNDLSRFVVSDFNGSVEEFSLSTPGDIGSTVSSQFDLSLSGEPRGVTWSSNGEKLYIPNSSSDDIVQFSI